MVCMINSFKINFCILILTFLIPLSGFADPSNCKDLLKALAVAQTDYNKAVGAWRQATVRASQADWALSLIKGRLEANDKKQAIAEQEFASAQADLVTCQNAEENDNGSLAPLIDCKAVPGRISKAKNDIAACELQRKKLVGELEAAQEKLEQKEDEAAAAHAVERATWGKLEEAKAAASECKHHA